MENQTAKVLADMAAQFQEVFGPGEETRTFFAPGRVNLIGEHTDYNGGHVFPCALTLGTYGMARKRKDRQLHFYSMNFTEVGVLSSSLDDLTYHAEANWSNYSLGVIWAYAQRGYTCDCGLDILVYGDIPNGSGLSSSASLEVMTGLLIREMYQFQDVTMVEIAKIGQESESKFNGMNCGIMDQFASAMGRKDHAIFLDTATLEYVYAPVSLPDAKIVIINSKVKHSLVDSAYNERRKQCETALADLKKVIQIQTLGDLTNEQFESVKLSIQDPVCRRRAKHAVYENQRTIEAVKALRRGEIDTFGKLMNASHVSLRDDYETSCPETDFLAEHAWNIPGVYGARITGGGFGGCVVCIVKTEVIPAFIEQIKRSYQEKTELTAEFYVVEIGDGAHVIA